MVNDAFFILSCFLSNKKVPAEFGDLLLIFSWYIAVTFRNIPILKNSIYFEKKILEFFRYLKHSDE